MDKFLIVDGNSIANRAYYAMPYLSNHEGKASGAVFGFANILVKIISLTKPTHVAVAFDHARRTFRNQIYDAYKGQRKPTPPELISQFPVIKQMLECMGIKTYEFENIEADDIIGTLSRLSGCENILLSGDRDLLQLISPNTTVWLTKKGVTEVDKVDETALRTEFGLISPAQVIELKGLMGDTSDNIPGVMGVGEKTAHTLLESYLSIDGVYENIDKISGKLKEKLLEGRDSAYMSRTLATIKTDCDINFKLDDCKLTFPFPKATLDFFKAWDFTSLLKNVTLYANAEPSIVVKSTREELTRENLPNFVASKSQFMSYNLDEMTFAREDGQVYFLQNNYDMFGSTLSVDEVLSALKPLFESESVLKLTTNAKADIHKLKARGINLQNYFDLSIAEYILSAGLKSHQNFEVGSFQANHQNLSKALKEEKVLDIYQNIELPLVRILADMEDNGFKIDTSKLAELDTDYTARLDELSEQIYEIAGEQFNINSPKQVAHILYDKLGIKTWNNKKQSTSADKLEEIRFIPIVDLILRHRKIAKLKNTYIDVYKEICSRHGDIIHTTFNQTLTSTGRLSSSEPNLQTIPTRDEEGREMRKIFKSRFEGGSLISADYNQIELRLLAHLSGEENLIRAYNEGQDIHTLTAQEIFGTKDVTPAQRRDAKAVNFGIIYGISDFGLSQNIKSSRAKAKAYIDSYFTRYPRVKAFMDENVNFATQNGYVRTMYGRVRKIPELSSSKYQTRSFGARVAMNMPMQGTASDIIKMAMIKVWQKLQGYKSKLILQIHDELIIDVFPGEEDCVCQILKEQMENVAKLSVPLLVNVGIGKNLYDCK